MEPGEHIAELRAHGEGLASAAAAAGLDAPVPSCPDWVVRDLVRHTSAVHRWATAFARGRTEPWDAELEEVAGGWPDDGSLLDWFAAGHRTLVAALEQAGPGLEAWTFLPAPSPLAMWARRQAHETAIHRVDAALAAGTDPDLTFAPAFAADGIDELLTGFVGRSGRRVRADPPVTLRIVTADAAGDWRVQIGAERATCAPGDGAADCTLTGTASELYPALWNRRSPAGVTVTGDRRVLDLFLDRLRIRW